MKDYKQKKTKTKQPLTGNYIFIENPPFKGGFYNLWGCEAKCLCIHPKHCYKCQRVSLLARFKNLRDAKKEATGYETKFATSRNLWCIKT